MTFVWTQSFAQLSPARQALSRMQKAKWKSAEDILRKALRKDTLNPEIRYVMSKYFFDINNPSRQVDSAYKYTLSAIRDFEAVSGKERDRLRRLPLDTSTLIEHRRQIDSAAYERAKQINTESSYNTFLAGFSFAKQRLQAIELRDEVAYVDALKTNTYQGFSEYIERYPSSHRAAEARARYEKLLFEDKTRDGKLKSYEAFLAMYPASPHRVEAERNVFEIMTASGKPGDFHYYLSKYSSGLFRRQADAILYHLLREEDELATMTLNDSLLNVQRLDQGYWIPVLRKGKFGFINHAGEEVMAPRFDRIDTEYICGNVKDDCLRVEDGIMSRNGQWITRGPVLDWSDVGAGFLRINTGACVQLVHKSGVAYPCADDGKLIARNFIAWKDHLRWGLMTLAGRTLMDAQFDDLEALDSLIILARNGKKTIVTIDELATLADHNTLNDVRVFDDVRRIANGQYVVRNGSLEGVLNSNLEFIVNLNRQQISKVQKGMLLKRDDKYVFSGVGTGIDDLEFDSYFFYGDWMKLGKERTFQLYDLRQKKTLETLVDSLWFEHGLAFAKSRDTLAVFLKSGSKLVFARDTRVTFLKSAGPAEFFTAPDKTRSAVYDCDTGKKLFAYEFDDLEYAGEKLFLVTHRGKKGLLSDGGKVVLPVEYTAIVPAGTGVLSLLKDKKFGMYNARTKKLLKPVYDRNVTAFSHDLLVAFQKGAYGFIAWDGKSTGEFEFDEVRPWNDTSAFVRKGFQWMIYSVGSHKVAVDKIKDYTFVSSSDEERVILIHRDVYYGVLSNRRGQVIAPNFSEIINLGSADDPLYFAEKNVEEAEIDVVIYYDKNGKLLAKQVYEEEEYDKIYCSQNN